MKKYKTERLILLTSDIELSAEVLNFYQKNKISFEATEPIDDSAFYTDIIQKRNLSMECRLISENKFFRVWMTLKDNPKKIIGTFSLSKITMGSFQSAYLGYKMDIEYRGKGYCTEALTFGINYAKDTLLLHKITATVNPNNYSSIKILEKLSFQREGLLKDYVYLNGKWTNHYIYSLILD